MRTLRLFLVGSVIAVVLAGASAVVLAQEDGDTAKVTPFTGVALSSMPDTSDEVWWEEDGVGHARTVRVREAIEWSDPRLPSEKQTTVNLDMYDIGEFREMPAIGTVLLEGPDGYWTGEVTTYCDADGDCYGMHVITGHKAYDGFFAIFRSSPPDAGTPGQDLYEGLIFEGEMPPLPEPVQPLSE